MTFSRIKNIVPTKISLNDYKADLLTLLTVEINVANRGKSSKPSQKMSD